MIHYEALHQGTTKPEQRQILMQRFNTDPRLFVFILSTRSGGFGKALHELPITSSTRILHPSLLNLMASYHVASNICMTITHHIIRRRLVPSLLALNGSM